MRKWVLLGLLLFVLSVGFTSGQAQYESEINKAMSCLDGKVTATALTLDQAVFAAWAGVPDNKVGKKINSSKDNGKECWPSGSCKVKDSAQVILAKKKMGEETSGAESWLLNQSGTATGLIWFLQITIDNNGPASCTVSYGGGNYKVDVNDDMTLSSGAGSCLSLANSNYWLEIGSECVDKTFEISCTNTGGSNFKTNLLYRKKAGGTVYISPHTSVTDQGGIATEKISAKCFKEGGSCNYEATLWAATALKGNQGEEFTPYLRVAADENQRYLPSAFLMHVLGDNSYAINILEKRDFGHWEVPGSPYSKYYDTSLAMMALGAGRGGANAPELSDTLTYLFGTSSGRDGNGCWGSLKDTAFIIYAAGWQRTIIDEPVPECGVDSDCSPGEMCSEGVCVLIGPACSEDSDCGAGETCIEGNCSVSGPTPIPPVSGEPNTCVEGYWIDEDEGIHDTREDEGYCQLESGGCCVSGYRCDFDVGAENESVCVEVRGGGVDPNPITDCEAALYYCVPNRISCTEELGNILPDLEYSCANPFEVCCTADARPRLSSCFDLGGEICLSDESCSSPDVQSSDGLCCTGICEIDDGPEGPGPSVECSVDADCNSGKVCENNSCVDGGGSSLWIWIVILLILIVLTAMGIIYRNKLRVWWFKMRGKTKSSKFKPGGDPRFGGRPGFGGPLMRRGPPMFGRRPMSRPPMRPIGNAPVKKGPVSAKEKEMDETLKKLREMSK